jgi:hypothetical protein
MVFHKKYSEEWERYITLSHKIKKEQSSKLFKDCIVLMISIAFIIAAMFFYRFEIKQDHLTYQQAFGALAAIFSLITIWTFTTDIKMKKIKEESPYFPETQSLENKLSNSQAMLEGFELIENKKKGKEFIESLLLKHAENAQIDC